MKSIFIINTSLIISLLLPFQSHAEENYSEVLFQIDVANEMQQLSWMSQMSYRISDYQKKLNSGEIQGNNEIFCNAPLLETNTIIEYLNNNHSGEKISAEQAIETVFMELESAYPCPK